MLSRSRKKSISALSTFLLAAIMVVSGGLPASSTFSSEDLQGLVLTTAALNPTFDPRITTYSASVTYDVSSLTVTPTSSAGNTIRVNGSAVISGQASSPIELSTGSNTITVIVTSESCARFAEDGSGTCLFRPFKSYTVTVTRAASSDADLSLLVLSTATLNPGFASATTSYTASVDYNISSLTVTPTASVSGAVITVNGTAVTSGQASSAISLNVGKNRISILVEGPRGDLKRYVVTVTRSCYGDSDADAAILSGLALSAGSLDRPFDCNPVSNVYSATVPFSVSSITVTPTGIVDTSDIKVNGISVLSGKASSAINLSTGSNTINVTVTSYDFLTGRDYLYTHTYTVNVTRSTESAKDLLALSLSGATLNPSFAFETTTYTASVANNVSSLTVTPTSRESITVNGTAVTSGQASSAISLSVGSNIITVIVRAADNTTKTYTVTVTRAAAASSDADLSALVLTTATLNPVFASATTSYTASVANNVSSLTVTPTASGAGAAVTVNGTAVTSGQASSAISLSVGSNIITVTVTAADTTTTKSYTVTVSRAADTTAPTLSGGSSSGITHSGVTLGFSSNEAGTYFYLILASGDSEPSPGTVVAQGAAVAKGTAPAIAASQTLSVTGLSASTSYKAYVVVRDAATNVSSVLTIAFTTTAASSQLPTPTNVSAVAGNKSATVTWQIAVGGSVLTPTSYRVELSTDSGLTWTEAVATGTGLSRTVAGLTNGRSYSFRVTSVATNATATSAQSNVVVPSDPTTVVVPDPVTPVKRVTVGTFNGFIAIYTVGYEGSRMSARVAGRWLTVNPITNVSGKTYSLTRRNTGAGFNIKVDVFIDGQLVTSQTVRTR